MEKHTIKVNDYTITFFNQYVPNRNGFKHCTAMFIENKDGRQINILSQDATCHYINRTWERYTYQSVMMQAADLKREQLYNALLKSYKNDNGIERLTAKRKAQFLETIKNDESLKLLDKIREALQ